MYHPNIDSDGRYVLSICWRGQRISGSLRADLWDSICLGILKTDQWKPNSKMNQGEHFFSSVAEGEGREDTAD